MFPALGDRPRGSVSPFLFLTLIYLVCRLGSGCTSSGVQSTGVFILKLFLYVFFYVDKSDEGCENRCDMMTSESKPLRNEIN